MVRLPGSVNLPVLFAAWTRWAFLSVLSDLSVIRRPVRHVISVNTFFSWPSWARPFSAHVLKSHLLMASYALQVWAFWRSDLSLQKEHQIHPRSKHHKCLKCTKMIKQMQFACFRMWDTHVYCLDSNVFVDAQRPSGRHCWKLPAEVSAAVANRVSNRVLLASLLHHTYRSLA